MATDTPIIERNIESIYSIREMTVVYLNDGPVNNAIHVLAAIYYY